jgi:hypothetical protein
VAAFLIRLFAVTYALVLVGLFHAAFNVTVTPHGFGGEFIPVPAEPWFFIVSGAVAVAAVLIVIFTRGRLAYKPNPPHA